MLGVKQGSSAGNLTEKWSKRDAITRPDASRRIPEYLVPSRHQFRVATPISKCLVVFVT